MGKLIVWGKDRAETIERMKRTLSEFYIEGVKTTIPFHQKVMQDEDFIRGNFNTHFLEKFEEGRS